MSDYVTLGLMASFENNISAELMKKLGIRPIHEGGLRH